MSNVGKCYSLKIDCVYSVKTIQYKYIYICAPYIYSENNTVQIYIYNFTVYTENNTVQIYIYNFTVYTENNTVQ